MFTLAISCLTTSNMPWFMDLTFQVPMQYCSLQHWIFLLSPVTSTTGYYFCFGSIPSFFLELLLHWSPVAYWAPNDLGSSSGYPIILPFHTVLKARILKWLAIPFSIGPHPVRPLHHDPPVLGCPTGMARFHWVRQACGERKSWLKAQHSENEDHGIRSHHFMGNRWVSSRNSVRLYFSGLQNRCRWWRQPWN